MPIELYSFDIFDTLITRTTATPKGIFALMQKKICESSCFADFPERLRNNFFYLRVQGEEVARNTFIDKSVKDVTIYQIYQCIRVAADLTENQTRRLIELEVETEWENSVPVTENIEKVKDLLDQKQRVVLISNMYLTQEMIRGILVHADPVFEGIKMYVSGELGKTKGTWTLYHYVKQQERVEFAQWEHLGDNQDLDVEIPLKLNMRAKWYHASEPLSWEQEFLGQREDNAALQLLAGGSRCVRKGHGENYPYKVGAGYGGPVLYPYVEWLLGESMRRGIRRLFFIARDGYILKEIADMIISYRELDIHTVYLFGSRKAWRLPSVTAENFDMKEFLAWNYPAQIYSYEEIAELFKMSLEDLSQFLPFPLRKGVILSGEVRDEVFRILTDNQRNIALYIEEHQKGNREAVIGYLRQVLGEETDSMAFVDLIGSGYTQRCLSELLNGLYSKEITTFFYRLDSCRIYEKNKNYSYYPNRLKMGNVIEVLCGANHGQTAGYRQDEGRWKPICENDEGQALDDYGFQDYLNGIKTYTNYMVQRWFWNSDILLDLSVPGMYFDYMAKAKDRKLYEYIADMPYGVRGTQKEVKCFAPALSDKVLRQLYLFRRQEPVRLFYSGYSLEFSLLRLTKRQRRKLARYKKYRESPVFKLFFKYKDRRQRGGRIDSRYDLIAKRIILYGAGKRGQLLYRQLTEGNDYRAEILLWVDQNYKECREKGLEVCEVARISECSGYDQVVIAVLDEDKAGAMRKNLLELGVSRYKILWIRPEPISCG